MKKALCVMDSSGDTRVQFDTNDAKATAEARSLFDRLKSTGAQFYKVGGRGPDQKVGDFEALGDETVVVPRIVGG